MTSLSGCVNGQDGVTPPADEPPDGHDASAGEEEDGEVPAALPDAVRLDVLWSAVNGTAGQPTALPVKVVNLLNASVNLSVRAAAPATGGLQLTLDVHEARGAWLRLDVPADLPPGEHALNVTAKVDDAHAVASDQVRLTVLADGAGAAEGDEVAARYVWMLTDGRMIYGNDPIVQDATFPVYQEFTPAPDPASWRLASYDEPLPGLDGAVLGLQETETRHVTLPPWQAFGNATREDTFSRQDVLPLRYGIVPPAPNVTRPAFEQFLAQSGQGRASQYQEGDVIRWYVERTDRPTGHNLVIVNATIVEKTADTVTLRHADVGETFTLPQLPAPFPHRASFTEQGATAWVLRVEPLVAPDTPFTWNDQWPDGSRITACAPSCDDYAVADNVTITNLDASWIGRNFTLQLEYEVEYHVVGLDEENIHVTRPNPHPLAGESVVFVVTRLRNP